MESKYDDKMTYDFLSKGFSARELRRDLTPVIAYYSETPQPKLAQIDPDIGAKANYLAAARTVANNIGVLSNGVTAIRVLASSQGVEMGLAMYYAICDIGGDPFMFIEPRLERGLDAILENATPESMESLLKSHNAAVDAMTHWTITYGSTGYSLSEKAAANMTLFKEHLNKPFSDHFNEKMSAGKLTSWNMVDVPHPFNADNIGMDFYEYEEKILKAMMTPTEEIFARETAQARKAFGNKLNDKQVVGLPGLYELEIGDTNIQFSVEGRQIFRDVGRVGTDVDIRTGKADYITNNPAGEFYVAPIENSVNGLISTMIPTRLSGGMLDETHLNFDNGLLVNVDTSDNDLFEADFPEKDPTTRVPAELGFGGQNPALDFLVEIGKPTGDGLIDEKVFPFHYAIGDNKSHGGVNTSSIHHDFSIDVIGKSGNETPLVVRKVA